LLVPVHLRLYFIVRRVLMEGNSVGRVEEYVVPAAPPPAPREEEAQPQPDTPAPEAPEDGGKMLDLYA
jgi:hypothetical protein